MMTNQVVLALETAAWVMLDPERGLPFDDDQDLAIVSAWLTEYASDVNAGILPEVDPNAWNNA